jgi:hypothetical protein
MNKTTLGTVPLKKNELLSKNIDEKAVILNMKNGFYYTTNHVGAYIWDICNGKNSVSDIIKMVKNEFEGNPEDIEKDIFELIDDMMDEKLLEAVK